MLLFPDARRCKHSISGMPDDTCDPTKLIIVMQDKTLIPVSEAKQQREEEYVDFLGRVLQYLQTGFAQGMTKAENGASGVSQPPILASNPREESIPYLLFTLTCVCGEFCAEPPEVGVYVYGTT